MAYLTLASLRDPPVHVAVDGGELPVRVAVTEVGAPAPQHGVELGDNETAVRGWRSGGRCVHGPWPGSRPWPASTATSTGSGDLRTSTASCGDGSPRSRSRPVPLRGTRCGSCRDATATRVRPAPPRSDGGPLRPVAGWWQGPRSRRRNGPASPAAAVRRPRLDRARATRCWPAAGRWVSPAGFPTRCRRRPRPRTPLLEASIAAASTSRRPTPGVRPEPMRASWSISSKHALMSASSTQSAPRLAAHPDRFQRLVGGTLRAEPETRPGRSRPRRSVRERSWPPSSPPGRPHVGMPSGRVSPGCPGLGI